MKTHRVRDLASELGISNKSLMKFIREHTDISIKSHMSGLDDDQVSLIKNKLNESSSYFQKNNNKKEIKISDKCYANDSRINILSALEIIKNNIKQSLTSYKEQVKNLSYYYHNECLVLVLGAGVSIDHNLPSWNILIQRLLFTHLVYDIEHKHDVANILSKLFTSTFAPDPLIASRYLYNKIIKKNDSLDFEELVRSAIYSNAELSFNSKLYQEIVQLCISPGKSPNLSSVITYNYDDILEKYITDTDLDIPFTSIYGPGIKKNTLDLPIYHVHGYLPRGKKLSKENRIILSENLYHQQYSDIYGWSNLVQLNTFKDKNCLLIGTSLSDPNLRRLLDIARNLRNDNALVHYCIKKRYSYEFVNSELRRSLNNDNIIDNETKNSLDIDELTFSLIDLIEDSEVNDAYSFGVDIIWVDDYAEIPELLKEIRNKW